MEPQTLSYGELTKYEQDIVSQGRGWDGTTYTDPKSGTVIELVDVDGQAGYRVLAKGDSSITGEVATEVPTAPEVTAPATDETPTVPTEPEAPVVPAPTDVQETTTDSAPETGATGLGATPATDVPPTPEPEGEKSFLGKVFGG